MNALKLTATPHRMSLLALAGFAVICSTSVMAQQTPGFYLGGSVGGTRSHFNNDAYNNRAVGSGFTVNSSSVDNKDTGGKVFGGYQLNPNFAVEGGYFDLGRHSYSGTTSGGAYSGNTRSHGLNLDLVGTLPVTDRLSVLGRVGAIYAKTRDSSSSAFAPPSTANRSSNDTSMKYGVGLQYAITDALSLRGELERYHRINDPIRRGNVDMASIGLVYRFGAKAQTPVAQNYAAPAPAYVAPPAPVAAAPAPAPAPVYVAPAPAPAPYVAPVRPAKEGRN
jgi:OOP family OmpA-OmpF porin